MGYRPDAEFPSLRLAPPGPPWKGLWGASAGSFVRGSDCTWSVLPRLRPGWAHDLPLNSPTSRSFPLNQKVSLA